MYLSHVTIYLNVITKHRLLIKTVSGQVRNGISGVATFPLSTSDRSRPRRRRLLPIHERQHTGTGS